MLIICTFSIIMIFLYIFAKKSTHFSDIPGRFRKFHQKLCLKFDYHRFTRIFFGWKFSKFDGEMSNFRSNFFFQRKWLISITFDVFYLYMSYSNNFCSFWQNSLHFFFIWSFFSKILPNCVFSLIFRRKPFSLTFYRNFLRFSPHHQKNLIALVWHQLFSMKKIMLVNSMNFSPPVKVIKV